LVCSMPEWHLILQLLNAEQANRVVRKCLPPRQRRLTSP